MSDSELSPEPWDIVVYVGEGSFVSDDPQEWEGVVDEYDEETGMVDLGIDGVIPIERVKSIEGKSPSMPDDSDSE